MERFDAEFAEFAEVVKAAGIEPRAPWERTTTAAKRPTAPTGAAAHGKREHCS
ncbi:hypothetical protein OG413_42480 [Streptomyces sp. NBC_01433]|uniref:hypothetical protein n=1 Tax=Streptomyces sp. NBC_01433 TaxID=2903864 RepID=UPI0022530D3E|nr:hypothetical protein [Streptomyces sp. NBC_01433]MCX4681873.1 hypothetical protein [Streptomyces sp. NBC_01433]